MVGRRFYLTSQLFSDLQHMHRVLKKGHQDIKPDNVARGEHTPFVQNDVPERQMVSYPSLEVFRTIKQ